MDYSTDAFLSWDEVKEHIDGRYVSAPDAVWRILGKPLQARSHTIVNLHVHVENEELPAELLVEEEEADVEAGDETREADAADAFVTALPPTAAKRFSPLLAWFKLNREMPEAREKYYYEIPEYFKWDKNKGLFSPRKNCKKVLGRMFFVSPHKSEPHHLRILLLHVKGATSYEDLRTYKGTTHPSYAAACVARKLTFDDSEWEKSLREAVQFKMPAQLRDLFASILAHCAPKDPLKLWTTFQVSWRERHVSWIILFRTTWPRIMRFTRR